MTGLPYTDADLNLVAGALGDASGYAYPDDLETWARYALDALAGAGRLLPAGSSDSVEWKVRWLSEGGGIVTHERHLISRGEAERLGPTRVGEYGITGWSVHHRTHRSYTDGSSWTGPWCDVEGEAS